MTDYHGIEVDPKTVREIGVAIGHAWLLYARDKNREAHQTLVDDKKRGSLRQSMEWELYGQLTDEVFVAAGVVVRNDRSCLECVPSYLFEIRDSIDFEHETVSGLGLEYHLVRVAKINEIRERGNGASEPAVPNDLAVIPACLDVPAQEAPEDIDAVSQKARRSKEPLEEESPQNNPENARQQTKMKRGAKPKYPYTCEVLDAWYREKPEALGKPADAIHEEYRLRFLSYHSGGDVKPIGIRSFHEYLKAWRAENKIIVE